MDEVTEISGPVCYFVFYYNNVKYSFFGDSHSSRTCNCESQGYSCADISTKISSCYTLPAYFDKLLRYNNKHKIKTNFYIEENFIVSNEDSDTNLLRKNNIISDDYLIATRVLLSPCLKLDIRECPYLPHVQIHCVDVREISLNQTRHIIDPFILEDDILELDDISELPELYSVLLFLVHNAENINNRNLESKIPDNRFGRILRNKLRESAIDSIVKSELNELKKLHKDLAEKITTFFKRKIKILVPEILSDLQHWYDNISSIEDYDSEYLEDIILPLSAISMDTYLLARMFRFPSEEVITYTGFGHSLNCVEFFQDFLNITPDVEVNNIARKIRCLHL